MNFSIYCQRNVLLLLVLGFSSGAPFLLTLSTLSFWLSEAHVSKSIIGLFILTTLPYSLKFLWSPFLERWHIPYLSSVFGIQKAWALCAQILLIFSIIMLGYSHPAVHLGHTAFWAICVSFFSATQDIVIDALRIDLLQEESSGAGAATETIGFRFGMMASGAGALYLAALYSWQTAYMLISACVIVGMLAILLIDSPPVPKKRIKNQFYFSSWKRLFQHPSIYYLIGFIFFFKLGDTVLSAMMSPFLWDLGYTKIEFAHVSKLFGILMMVMGGLAGGLAIYQLGLIQTVIFCAILQSISCLLFVIQALVGHNMSVLYIAVGVESFTSGCASAAFMAYLAHYCKAPYSASHFTLLYSVGSLSRVMISSLAGVTAQHYGWSVLFFISSLATVPVLYFLMRAHQAEKQHLKPTAIKSFEHENPRHFI